MALLHRASLTPSKQEVLDAWVPTQPWCTTSGEVRQVGSYRFDDPAGAVGLETFLVVVGDGPVLQVPLSYRGAPLLGAQDHLVATMEHSELGRRWIYDACADPVYSATLATVIVTGGHQAEQYFASGAEGQREYREPTTHVTGSGVPGLDAPDVGRVVVATDGTVTTIVLEQLGLVVHRVVGVVADAADAPALTGTWPGVEEPALLATLVTRD